MHTRNAYRLVAALALGLPALVPAGARVAAAEDEDARVHPFRIEIALAGGRERFHRGGLDPAAPVRDLFVTITLTNTDPELAYVVPEPRIRTFGGPEFDIHLRGAPTGIRATAETPKLTKIRRNPLAFPVGLTPELPEITLPPGQPKQFNVDAGGWYNVAQAGKYEMSCRFEEEESNTVTFEVMPLKVVNMRVNVLLSRIEDFERGGPSFPFMFYVARSEDRFDEIVYLVRRGRGADEHLEFHRLAELRPGTVPDMITSPDKVGLVGVLCPDKRSPRKSRLFVIDFGRRPLKVRGKEIIHEPGERPGLVVKPGGDIGVEAGAPPIFLGYTSPVPRTSRPAGGSPPPGGSPPLGGSRRAPPP